MVKAMNKGHFKLRSWPAKAGDELGVLRIRHSSFIGLHLIHPLKIQLHKYMQHACKYRRGYTCTYSAYMHVIVYTCRVHVCRCRMHTYVPGVLGIFFFNSSNVTRWKRNTQCHIIIFLSNLDHTE